MSAERTIAAAAATALLAALPVAAAADTAVSPAQAVAEALEGAPVHVDPAYGTAFPEDERDRVAARIGAEDLELYVIAVPLTRGDPWNGDPEALASAVHDRRGGGEAHYLVYGGEQLTGTGFGTQDLSPAYYGALAASYGTGFDGGPVEQVDAALDAAYSPDPEAAYHAAREEYEEGRPSYGLLFALPRWALWAGVLLLVLLAAAAALLVGRALGARTRRGVLRGLPQHAAFANADRARLERLVDRGGRELVELGERLSSARGVPAERLSRALDARDAAAAVHDRMLREGTNLPDAVGVLVLLDLAEDALAGLRTPRRPCYADPLHGSGTRPVQWRQFGGTHSIRVPLCADCARAVRGRVRPTVLPAEHDGATVPYYEVPADRSVWAATGYGTLTDDLVARIQRGEHRRGAV